MKKPDENVVYGETNVHKFTDANRVTSGLVSRFMTRCANHLADLTKPGQVILDCGVSEGTMTRFLADRLPDRRIVSLEYEAEGCRAFHRTYPDLDILRASIYDLPLPDQSVDAATAFEVLEHLEDPAQALREMRRVSRGPVVVTVPYEPFFRMGNVARGKYLTRLGNTPGHINHWNVTALRRLASSALPAPRVERAFPWLMVTAPG